MRTILFATTALVGLSGFSAAAACTLAGDTVTCATGTTTSDQRFNEPDLKIDVEAGATVDAASANAPALRIDGNNTSVANNGIIINPNTNNNNSNNAIEIRGTGQVVTNSGQILSGDRAIHSRGGDVISQ